MNADKEFLLSLFEDNLNKKLPTAYRTFLLETGSKIIDGFSVIGFPTKDIPIAVFDGYETIREKRNDLPGTFLPVIFTGTNACCLDLELATEKDAPLVEIDLESSEPPKRIEQTFSEWIEYHEKMERRFARGWARVRNRQAETEEKHRDKTEIQGEGKSKEKEKSRAKGMHDWSCPIFRVKDYIIGIGAFRFNNHFGALEADEFLPINQPHLAPGEAVKVLLSEALARARDYSGSLNVQFTKDTREDENGVINEHLPYGRIPAPIPREILEMAKAYSIEIPHPEKGFLAHKEAAELWFASLEMSKEIEGKIRILEKTGYLTKEMLAELISLGLWTKEEAIWIFLNAPRPEGLLLGSDSVGDRISYSETMSYGRAALLATHLKYAIIASMNKGFTMEEIEEAEIMCSLEPKKDFWLLSCNEKFNIPEMWLAENSQKLEHVADKPILLLCRPQIPQSRELDKERLAKYLDILLQSTEQVQTKYLVLSNEYASPDYCKFLEDVRSFVEEAKVKGINVIFAPTRTGLYLDEAIRERMRKARSMTNFPSRFEPKKLQIFQVPSEFWIVSEDSQASRAIQNAAKIAVGFAQQLVARRNIKQSEAEFSLMSEVIEREASQKHRFIAEIDGPESLELTEALWHSEKDLRGISFSFVVPEEMPKFRKRLKSEKLISIFQNLEGGIVALVKPWEYSFAAPKAQAKQSEFFNLPPDFQNITDETVKRKKANREYASNWNEIDRAHEILRKSLSDGLPFSTSSMWGSLGRVRVNVFTEMIIDYVYQVSNIVPINLPIAYGDGTKGGPFPLFSLPRIELPDARNFFNFKVGFITLRHGPSDKYIERSLIRNREIQSKDTAADQEELAFKRTFECLDEIMRFMRGELTNEKDFSPSLGILLGYRPELKTRSVKGMDLHIFHTTGLESAGIGTYLAILQLLNKYRGQVIVTPRILIPNGEFQEGEKWF
ncbi:MAG: SMI1/KNR4 family protein [Candidatus Harrisonbacteria bacterium]|nr:SMI1/KNR4 family protein [Candidatus Harrisonbacteria bacterium]